MKKIELVMGVMRVPLDFVLTVAAMGLAYKLRLGWAVVPLDESFRAPEWGDFMGLVMVGAGILVGVMAVMGRYDFGRREGFIREAGRVLAAILVWLGVTLGLLFFLNEDFFSRLVVIYAVGLIFVILMMERYVLNSLRDFLQGRGVDEERVVIIGMSKVGMRVLENLKREGRVRVLGIIEKKKGEGVLEDLRLTRKGEVKLGRRRVDTIVQVVDLNEREKEELVNFCRNYHVRYVFVPDVRTLERVNVETVWVGEVPMIELKPTPLEGWGRVVKRGVDIMGAGLGLIIFSPVFIGVALAIKLDSPGPVFFARLPDGSRVKRVGRGGEEINFLKFRTMRHNSHNERYTKLAKHSHRQGPLVKIKNDPRVTRVGRLLRRWSLDELPQLWNVLMGELSLVGPRAHLPEEVEKYAEYQRRVLAIKPGITGMAQVSGRSDLDFEKEVRLDLWYIERWGLWLDFKIILKTIDVVIRGKGAD